MSRDDLDRPAVTTQQPGGRGQKLGALMGLTVVVALTVGAFSDPWNPVVATLAFGAWTMFLTRAVIDMLSPIFRPLVRNPEAEKERADAFGRHVRDAAREIQNGRYDDALGALEQAEELFPGRLDVALLHAEALLRTGRLGEAVRSLEFARAQHAGDPVLHYTLARCYCLVGDLVRASDELDVAGSIDREAWAGASDDVDFRGLRDWLGRSRLARD